MAQRIRRERTKGWRLPSGAVYVGRPTRWGNPYLTGVPWPYGDPAELQHLATPQDVVDDYVDWAHGLHVTKPRFTLADVRLHLGGRDLACWCPLDQPCHADVLLELANGDPS